MRIVLRVVLILYLGGSGVGPGASIVNTLLKKSFRASAFSLSDLALLPSVFCRLGMPLLLAVLDFIYFHMLLGLDFASDASLYSVCLLPCQVSGFHIL